MLVNEVVNSASIALSATKDASNDIPFLGLNWFNEKKKSGLPIPLPRVDFPRVYYIKYKS